MAESNHLFNPIPREIICEILSNYLSLQDISLLDAAMCNKRGRPGFLEIIGSVDCFWVGDKEKNLVLKVCVG
jgi:hypothetical protein